MNQTWRGLLVFLGALVTIGLWAPLSNDAERTAAGTIVTRTYFGAFRYATLNTRLKEPDYSMTMTADFPRLFATLAGTAVLWVLVIYGLRRMRANPPPGRADTR